MFRYLQLALVIVVGLSLAGVILNARASLVPSSRSEATTEFDLEVPQDGDLPSDDEIAEADQDSAKLPEEASEPDLNQTSARSVGGGMIATPITPDTQLERIAPLPQPTPPQAREPTKAIEVSSFKRWRLVYNTVITSAGVFEINGTAIVLPGIDVVAENEYCTTAGGSAWPCGKVARTAFRNHVMGRALNCHLPDIPPQQAFVAECLLQGRDPAEWLVEHGWARAKTDSQYASTEQSAKSALRGIYGNPPIGVESSPPLKLEAAPLGEP